MSFTSFRHLFHTAALALRKEGHTGPVGTPSRTPSKTAPRSGANRSAARKRRREAVVDAAGSERASLVARATHEAFAVAVSGRT